MTIDPRWSVRHFLVPGIPAYDPGQPMNLLTAMSPQGFKVDFPEAPQSMTYTLTLSLSRHALTDQAPSRRSGPVPGSHHRSWLCSQSPSLPSTRVLARSQQEERPCPPHPSGPLFIPSKETFQTAEVHASNLYLNRFQGMCFLERTLRVSCPSP